MLRYSTIIAALILAGSAVTASAASKTAHHRYHGLYMQAPTPGPSYNPTPQYYAPNMQDDSMTDHAKGSIKDD
jgi:hypothetical protein